MNKVKIGDFLKLTGCTLKAINYYHKIGLLPEPERSEAGYRLYGSAELNRMRLVKHLKSLGLCLKDIKETVGDSKNPRTSREVLQSLRSELSAEKQVLEDRLAKIDALLNDEAVILDEGIFDSPSFQMISEIMGAEQIEKYVQTCPEIYDQHRKLYSILDDFQWGEDYQDSFRSLADYFSSHPEQYQAALETGARWAEIARLDEDDPRIEALARESAELVKNMPPVRELYTSAERGRPLESLYKDMVADVLSPAQLKYQKLFEKLLSSED